MSGPFSSIAGSYVNSSDDHHIRVWDAALAQLREFVKGDSATNVSCLAKLLEHFRKIQLCDAYAAFIVDSAEHRATYIVANGISRANIKAIAECKMTQAACDSGRTDEDFCVYDSLTVANGVKSETAAAIRAMWRAINGRKRKYEHCVVIRSRAMPLLRDRKAHIVMYFLPQPPTERVFAKKVLALLIPVWASAYGARLLSFRDALHAQDVTAGDRIQRATGAQAWLTAAEVWQLCEGHCSGGNGPVAADLKDLKLGWHCCIQRPWPCDDGRRLSLGRGDQGMLDWFEWRLSEPADADQFERTVDESMATVAEWLGRNPSVPLDTQLSPWFLNRILASLKHGLSLPPSTTDQHRAARTSLARFASSVLASAPHTAETVEALIWTLSQYAYQVLGVDRRLHLASHIRHGARGESSLHMMREFYRDHFFHTIEVCLLGDVLGGAQLGTRPPASAFGWDKDFRRQWYLAALLHDIGYAVDVCKGLKDWLGFFASKSFASLGTHLGEAIKAMEKDLEGFYEIHGFKKDDKPWEDHGLVGAHHLRTLVDDIEKHAPVHPVNEAISAIAKHNCQTIAVSYAKEPMAALLVLCDTLQAWRRPQFPHFSMGPAWVMAAMASSEERQERPETTLGHLVTNLRFVKSGGDLIPTFTPPLVLRLEFDGHTDRDSFVFNTWLDLTCNLQRVDFRALPYDIIVQVVTPAFGVGSGRAPQKQMDRLRDAASDTHMAYLSPWLEHCRDERANISAVDNVQPCCRTHKVCYHVEWGPDSEPRREMLCISLRKMKGKMDLVMETMSRFRDDLRRWKKYQEDRTVVGDHSPWRHHR